MAALGEASVDASIRNAPADAGPDSFCRPQGLTGQPNTDGSCPSGQFPEFKRIVVGLSSAPGRRPAFPRGGKLAIIFGVVRDRFPHGVLTATEKLSYHAVTKRLPAHAQRPEQVKNIGNRKVPTRLRIIGFSFVAYVFRRCSGIFVTLDCPTGQALGKRPALFVKPNRDETRPGLPWRSGLARSGPGAARAWIQVSARERGIPLLDGVFPARAENPNRRHRLRHAPDLGLATGR